MIIVNVDEFQFYYQGVAYLSEDDKRSLLQLN